MPAMPKKSKTNNQSTNRKPIESVPKAVVSTTNTDTPNVIWWQRPFVPIVIIFATAFLLYANTLGHSTAQDDAIVITQNEYTQQGIAGIGGLWDYDTFKGFFKTSGKDNLVSGGRYRPFTPIMFAIENQLFGTAGFDAKTQCFLVQYFMCHDFFNFEKIIFTKIN
jgi:protein O-mannosyl-transferase